MTALGDELLVSASLIQEMDPERKSVLPGTPTFEVMSTVLDNN